MTVWIKTGAVGDLNPPRPKKDWGGWLPYIREQAAICMLPPSETVIIWRDHFTI